MKVKGLVDLYMTVPRPCQDRRDSVPESIRGAYGSVRHACRSHRRRHVPAPQRASYAGFRDPVDMPTDHALDVLRSRPDFQILMLDAAMPDEPFEP